MVFVKIYERRITNYLTFHQIEHQFLEPFHMFKHIFEHAFCMLNKSFVDPRYIALNMDSKRGYYKPLHFPYTLNVSDHITNFNVL